MAPVTLFISTTLNPGVSVDSLHDTLKIIKEQPGNQAVRVGATHEDAAQARLFVDWDSLDSNLAFRGKEAFGAFVGALKERVARPPTVFHAELSPYPPAVLDNDGGKGQSPVAHVLLGYFAPDVDASATLAKVQGYVSLLTAAGFDGLTGDWATGWSVEKDIEYKGEKTRVLVAVMGWKSVEAHQAVRATDEFKALVAEFEASLEGLKGFETAHVTTKSL